MTAVASPRHRLADTAGAMLTFAAGVLFGHLLAASLHLARMAGALCSLGTAVLAVTGTLLLTRQPTGDPLPTGLHRFRARSPVLAVGALLLGLATSGWGLRALASGRFVPALVLGPAILAGCLVLLFGRTLSRTVRIEADGLVITDLGGTSARLRWSEMLSVLGDRTGALHIDAGDRHKNLLLPAEGSLWSTFYVTGVEAIGQVLRRELGERFHEVDGLLPALRRLARGEDPLQTPARSDDGSGAEEDRR
jgi:hypothetical protein